MTVILNICLKLKREVKAIPNKQESKLVEKREMDSRTYDLVRSNVLFSGSGLSFIAFYSHCLLSRTTWPGLSGQAVKETCIVNSHVNYSLLVFLNSDALVFNNICTLLLAFSWAVLNTDNLVNCHFSVCFKEQEKKSVSLLRTCSVYIFILCKVFNWGQICQ